MEGVFRTGRGVPLHLGGVAVDGQLCYAIEIPNGLSLLAHWNLNALIRGLDQVPPADRPPVNIVRWAFQVMVGCGFALLALAGWATWSWSP